MKRIEKAMIAGLILSVIVGSYTAFAQECGQIRESVLRLHILANSDNEEDQALKLKVRDRILSETGELFEEAADLDSAENQVAESMQYVKQIAEDEIRKQGFDYPVNVELCNMFFNTRQYDGVTMPAGRYDAMRVTIGKAEGQNWWCVLYPPMCIPAAQPKKELDEVLDQGELEIVQSSPKYEVRFACVELFERLKEAFTQ